MPELPYTALPTPTTPIGDLKSWRLIIRCAKCNRKVVLALPDIAERFGAALPVWRAIDRLRVNAKLKCPFVPQSQNVPWSGVGNARSRDR
jgi:hypothetical protein